ncbi:MAG: hypothetical protein U5Q16_14400 [Gammaproteobacteria bacterium]|nr:hypothetical protein [Gammaproteobacteria bacterium]
MAAFTPANHVGGWGTIDGRMAVVCADDFTSRGGHADGAIGQKSRYLDELSVQMKVPSLRLLDGSVGRRQRGRHGASAAGRGQPALRSRAATSPPDAAGGGYGRRPFLPGHLGSSQYAATTRHRCRW